MTAFTHHVFVCGNQRSPDHRRGCCDCEGKDELRNELKTAAKKAGLKPNVRINKAGCLDQCEHGPVMVIYPQGIWYGGVSVDDVPRIVEETLVKGEVIKELVIADECLNNPNCPHIAESQCS